MFEVSRYNFNYSIDKNKHKYSLPDNKEILKNMKEFNDFKFSSGVCAITNMLKAKNERSR